MNKDINIWQIVVVFLMMGFIFLLADWGTANNETVKKVIYGEPKILIKDGQINQEILEQERLSVEELESRLRILGVFDIRAIKIAYLEYSGEISVLRRGETNGCEGD